MFALESSHGGIGVNEGSGTGPVWREKGVGGGGGGGDPVLPCQFQMSLLNSHIPQSQTRTRLTAIVNDCSYRPYANAWPNECVLIALLIAYPV